MNSLKDELSKRWSRNGIHPEILMQHTAVVVGLLMLTGIASLCLPIERSNSLFCFGIAMGGAAAIIAIFIPSGAIASMIRYREAVKMLKGDWLWDLAKYANIGDLGQAACSKLAMRARRVVICEADLEDAAGPDLIQRELDLLREAQVEFDKFWFAVGPDGFDLVSGKKLAFDQAKKELGL